MNGLAREIEPYIAWFSEHVEGFRQGESTDVWLIDLKKEHSLKVLEEAAGILLSLDLPLRLCRDILLAALFHDLGRFPQYRKYRTFQDAKSANHAVLSSIALGRTRVLDRLPDASRKLVREAVILHNRKSLPGGVQGEARMAANLVRDADKLDIVRIMLEDFTSAEGGNKVVRLGACGDDDGYSPEIVRSIFERRIGDNRFMKNSNDFKLLLLSWIYDLNYQSSRESYLKRGYVKDLFALLPKSEELALLEEHIYTDLRSL